MREELAEHLLLLVVVLEECGGSRVAASGERVEATAIWLLMLACTGSSIPILHVIVVGVLVMSGSALGRVAMVRVRWVVAWGGRVVVR